MEVHILSYMMDIFFIFTLHILYKKILEIRFEGKAALLFGWGIYLVIWNICSYVFADNPLINGLCSLFVNFLVLNILYTGSMRAKFILVFVVMVLGIISETIVSSIFMVLGINISSQNEGRNNYLYIGNAISKVFCFLFVKIITYISKKDKQIKVSLNDWIETFVVPIGSLVIFYIVAWDNYFNITISKLIIFGILLIINILTYYIYQRVQMNADEMMNNQMLIQQNEYYKERYKETEKQWTTLRKMRHDMTNNYVLELSYLENGQYDKLKAIYTKAIGSLKNPKSIVNTGNIGIDSIINYKMEQAKELNINVIQEVKVGANVYIDNGDLNILLGNLFDNAIEAVSKVPEEKKVINFKIIADKTALLFEISNTYNGIIARNQKGEIVTTKVNGKNHGIGLKAVMEVVNRYDGKFSIEQEGDKVLVKSFLHYKD